MSSEPHPTHALVESFISKGPTLVLVDGAAPGCGGLTAFMRDKVVLFDLAGPMGREILDDADPERLRVPYGLADGGNEVADLPWEAVFAVAGRIQADQMTTRTRMDRLPACLGPDRRLAMRWLMRHLNLGDSPPDPSEWRLEIRPDMLLVDATPAGFEADPRAALARCLAMDPPAAALLLDVGCPGLELPAAWPRLDGGAAQLMVIDGPPLMDLIIDERGVAYLAPLRDGDTHLGPQRFFLPWAAIGALQHPSQTAGWFWPARLPEGMREPLRRNPDLAPQLERLAGAPIAARPEPPDEAPPLALLPPANDLPKPQALQDCDARGGGMLLLDARHSAVTLTPGLAGAGLLAVPFGVDGLATTISFDGDSIEATLPGFEGETATVSAPWEAVFVIASNQGALRVHCWPEDYPDDIAIALSLLRHMAANDGQLDETMLEGLPLELGEQPPDLSGRGVAVGLGRDESGQYVLQLVQRCGPTSPEGRTPELRVSFVLRMKTLH